MAHAYFPEFLYDHCHVLNAGSMKLNSATCDVSGIKLVVVAGGIIKPWFYPPTKTA
jgi:hypothetical protein